MCLNTNPSFLASLTQLTSVFLVCRSQVDPMLLVAALSRCTRIERMQLVHSGFTSTHLCALLPSLPLLAYLNLMLKASLTSLSFASSVGHLARNLTMLSICHCTALPPEEVRHLRALTALRRLVLDGSFNAPLDDDTIASMSPASQTFDRNAWSHLTRFNHAPRGPPQ